MLSVTELDLLRRQLEGRFGLSITAAAETIDGGIFPVLRLAGVEPGTGFCIVMARTHRQVEASFRADNFAAGMLRRMAEADQAARDNFAGIASQAREKGAKVYAGINGNAADTLPAHGDPWRKLELDVSMRLPSGALQGDRIMEPALDVSSFCLSLVMSLLWSDDPGETQPLYEEGLPEGASTRVTVNRYERSPANRAACIAHYGAVCKGCGFTFQEVYGPLGEGYIEVHHRMPLSRMGGQYVINPVTDLVPLCANCHAMVHRRNPPLELNELQAIVRKTASSGDHQSASQPD